MTDFARPTAASLPGAAEGLAIKRASGLGVPFTPAVGREVVRGVFDGLTKR